MFSYGYAGYEAIKKLYDVSIDQYRMTLDLIEKRKDEIAAWNPTHPNQQRGMKCRPTAFDDQTIETVNDRFQPVNIEITAIDIPTSQIYDKINDLKPD